VIESEFGFRLKDLPIQEQFYFLNHLKHTTIETAETMQHFTQTFGVDGMRTFLTLERAGEITGDEIVRFAIEHEAQATTVFESFGHLLDAENELRNFVQTELNCTKADCETILNKATERIKNEAYNHLIRSIKDNASDTLPEIDDAIARARSLSAAFTAYFAQGGRSAEDLQSFESRVTTGPELNQDTRDQLTRMYRENYRKLGYTETAITDLVHTFEDSLNQRNSRVWSWNIGNRDTLAFAVTLEEPDLKHVFVSGLNINPDLKASRAGRDLLEQITAHYRGLGWILTAEAAPDNFRGYSEGDWVATEITEDYLDAEAHLFQVAILPNAEFASKKLSRRELSELIAGRKTLPRVTIFETTSEHTTPVLEPNQVITRLVRIPARAETPARYVYILENVPTPTATAPQT
jgi:hypothetical protein